MKAENFIKLVREMRTAQNSYYRNGRKQSDLIQSKQLEKQVDEALKAGITFGEEVLAGENVAEKSQPTLFE